MDEGVRLWTIPTYDGLGLVVHGGAGADPGHCAQEAERYREGLRAAVRAGEEALTRGDALEAVCAAVVALEDAEMFNAGRGAALTATGEAELDAAVMTHDADGTRRAGAVTCVKDVRNPVLAARAVMERTPHVLIASPGPQLLASWGVARVDPSYFVTDRRRAQLAASGGFGEYRHGTVGAVARDRSGRVAAATSTGGVSAQLPGRVGDTPLIGAGTFADASTAAISCTGTGEFFVRGVLAHDVHARMRYAGASLAQAASEALAEHLASPGADGGLIGVNAAGEAVLAWNSPLLLCGARTPEGIVTRP